MGNRAGPGPLWPSSPTAAQNLLAGGAVRYGTVPYGRQTRPSQGFDEYPPVVFVARAVSVTQPSIDGKVGPAFKLRTYVNDCFEEQMSQVEFDDEGMTIPKALAHRVAVSVSVCAQGPGPCLWKA